MKSSQPSFLALNHVAHNTRSKVYDCEDGKYTSHVCMVTNVLFILLKYQEKWSINVICNSIQIEELTGAFELALERCSSVVSVLTCSTSITCLCRIIAFTHVPMCNNIIIPSWIVLGFCDGLNWQELTVCKVLPTNSVLEQKAKNTYQTYKRSKQTSTS